MSRSVSNQEIDPRLLAIKFALMKTLGPRAPLTRSAVKAVEEETPERRETIIAHIMMALEDLPGAQRTAISKVYNATLPEIRAFHGKQRRFVRRPGYSSQRATGKNASP